MFTLKLFDRKKQPLKEGDIVKISDSRQFTFFCEVKYLPKEKVITPFHTFSFHSFEKIDAVPQNAIKSTEERYNIWYVYEENAEEDKAANLFESFLTDWRVCERLIDSRCFDIEKTEVI